MIMYERWDVLPDGEREQWVLEPFESVGPLRFGMLIDEVSNILSRRTDDLQRYSGPCLAEDPYGLVTGRYRSFGLTLYYWDERLRGVSADALCGPQVSVEGVALTGRRPSELGKWLWGRADALAPAKVLVVMGGGEFCSESLGDGNAEGGRPPGVGGAPPPRGGPPPGGAATYKRKNGGERCGTK
ncbi:hypothetical protein ACGF0D_21610, partial [Kitasatospora sp. NPDC048298]